MLVKNKTFEMCFERLVDLLFRKRILSNKMEDISCQSNILIGSTIPYITIVKNQITEIDQD